MAATTSARPGFSFIACPDPELIRQRIETLVEEHGQGAAWERRVHWGDDENLAAAYWDDLGLVSLLGGKRLVVLRRADKQLAAFWDALSPRLASFNDGVWPVFCLESEWTKPKGRQGPSPKIPKPLSRQKYWSLAEDRGWIWSSPGLTDASMPDFVRDYARRCGLSLTKPVGQALCRALPQDAVGARNELDKLALLAGESGQVLPGHLEIVGAQEDMDIFSFVDAVVRGDRAEQVWRRVFADRLAKAGDRMLFGFLHFLVREARILWQLSHGEEGAVYLPGSVKNRKRELAARLGENGIARLFELALEAEMGIKTGIRRPEQAFEALVGGLYASLGAPKRPRAVKSVPQPPV